MNVVPIKTPNTDDVFEKWINKMDANSLKKKFEVKGVPFQKGNISAAESVKNVQKFTVIYFQSEKKSTGPTDSGEIVKTDLKGIAKTKFYEFSKTMDSETWKEKSKLPLYETLNHINCEKCKGTGFINCKKCKGERLISCKDCKGQGSIKCKDCDGTGTKEIDIFVVKNGKEKTKRKMKYRCPTCFGSGKMECKKCGGTGKITCPDCKANARYRCDKCKGVGHFFNYSLGFVPFDQTSAVVPHLFFRAEIEKELGYRLSNVIQQVDGIQIRDLNKMKETDVVALLGYELDSNAKKMMSTAKKTFEQLQKSEIDKPILPIYIFPVIELDIETPKKKSFKLFSIGSETGYTVIDHGFK